MHHLNVPRHSQGPTALDGWREQAKSYPIANRRLAGIGYDTAIFQQLFEDSTEMEFEHSM